jgi:hypothetical protein
MPHLPERLAVLPLDLPITAWEDKIVQQATKPVLECVYEADFLGFSYFASSGNGCGRACPKTASGRKRKWGRLRVR